MAVFKRFFTWFLIFQYFNVNVLYADLASTRVIFDNPQGSVAPVKKYPSLRIPENHSVYSVLVGGKGNLGTRPDLPLMHAGVTDIKNVKYITFTKQLQAQEALAKKEGKSFNLVISPRTQKIAVPLRDTVIETGGKFFEFNPTTQKWIQRIVDGNRIVR